MHDIHQLLDNRARRLLQERIRPAQFEHVSDCDISVWHVTDSHDGHETRNTSRTTSPVVGQGEPVSFAEAIKGRYEPFSIGSSWGPPWGNSWFIVTCQMPSDIFANKNFKDYELDIDLGWEDHSPGFQAEGLIYTLQGKVVKAINPRNTWIPVLEEAIDSSGCLSYYIEAAANPLLLGVPPFQPTLDGDKLTATSKPLYTLRSARLVRVNKIVRQLALDLEVLSELALTLPDNSQDRHRLITGINDAMNRLDVSGVSHSACDVDALLQPLLHDPALPHAHHLVAVGHAHIDSAWLWPLRETRRKCVRTLANVLRLLDDGREMIFALPAAQHLRWIEEDAPQVFERVKDAIQAKKIVPVGGMWVECDAVMPGGEAMCRQFLYGQQYFHSVSGRYCQGMWLPDSFGYSAALPQIAVLSGARWFLTQKLSWNQTDVFPHHTLFWEGIDGTRLFTHFPPVDTYGAENTPRQLTYAAENFKDKARASYSLLPYGYGDGGGGPTREMLERAQRMSNLRNCPTISHDSPDNFFQMAREDYPDAPVWVGELYLELHRGTLTSQARVKAGNRLCEAAMREAETWLTYANIYGLMEYPWEKLRTLWRDVCLAQFHDILPGSSIAWVYRDVHQMHERIISQAESLRKEAQCAITSAYGHSLCFNSAPVQNKGIAPVSFSPTDDSHEINKKESGVGSSSHDVLAGLNVDVDSTHQEITHDDSGWLLHGSGMKAHVTDKGLVDSYIGTDGRNCVPPGISLGQLWIYQDFPCMWDAWDIDEYYRATGKALVPDSVTANEKAVKAHYAYGKSHLTVTYCLDETNEGLRIKVDALWNEKEKLLKIFFPLDIHTDSADYETQFGYLTRPIHTNTTWESNKFEVSAHRWIYAHEPQWGVGIANTATYGWSHMRCERQGGGTYVAFGASLLRAPRFPDPHTDRGDFHREFIIVPGKGHRGVRDAAYRMQLPLTSVEEQAEIDAGTKTLRNNQVITSHSLPHHERDQKDSIVPLIGRVSGVIIEALKQAEDKSGDTILRLYEPDGNRCRASVSFNRHIDSIKVVDILERCPDDIDLPQIDLVKDNASFEVHPFQIVTLKIRWGLCASE